MLLSYNVLNHYVFYVYRYQLCESKGRVGEFGVYDVILDETGEKCDATEALQPVNAHLALLYSFLVPLLSLIHI